MTFLSRLSTLAGILLFPAITSPAQIWRSSFIENIVQSSSRSQVGGSSLKNVNGKPGFAYFDGAHDNLMFVRAKDEDGTAWNLPQLIDWEGSVGAEPIMEIVNGKPAILYLDIKNSILKYIAAKDADGLNWNSPIIIEKSNFQNFDGSLRVVNGKPAVSYSFGGTNSDFNLRYCQAIDGDGNEWGEPVNIENNGFLAFGGSLEIVNGFPAITYVGQENYVMKYVRASDADGKTWNAPTAIDTVGGMVNCTLAIFGGKPTMVYWNLKSGYLCVRHSKDENGMSWEQPIALDSLGTVGKSFPSAMAQGLPAIVYTDFKNGRLKYIRATDAEGHAWGSSIIVDSVGLTGYAPSLQIINGKPAISYSSSIANTGRINFIQAKDAAGETWNVPVSFNGSARCGQMINGTTINGLPTAVYSNNGLVYAQASDSTGMNWKQSVVLDKKASTYWMSLKSVAGKPAVCYYDQGLLKYLRSNDESGDEWPMPTTFAYYPNDFGGLETVNGLPAVVYSSVYNDNIYYVRGDDADGKSWAVVTVFDSEDQGYLGRQSLNIVNGNPALCYTTKYMKLVLKRSADETGTTWNPSTIIDQNIYTSFVSFDIINGLPAVAYYDNKNKNLKFALAQDADGLTWNKPIVVDSIGDVGSYPSLKDIGGYPTIAYLDATNHLVKHVRALDVAGISWNTAVVLADVTLLYAPPDDGPPSDMGINLMQAPKGSGVAYFHSGEQLPVFAYGLICKRPLAPQILIRDTTICQYDSITLTFDAGSLLDADHWQWRQGSYDGNPISRNEIITVLPQTTTKYYARGEGGCTVKTDADSVTIHVTSRPLKPTITLSNSDSTVTMLKASGGISYEWFLDGISLGITSDTMLVAHTAGLYTVRSLFAGCTSEFSDSVEFAIAIMSYPNPATTQLSVTIPPESVNLETTIEIVNLQGGIENSIKSTGRQAIAIDIGGLVSGEYLLRIAVGGVSKSMKFLKL